MRGIVPLDFFNHFYVNSNVHLLARIPEHIIVFTTIQPLGKLRRNVVIWNAKPMAFESRSPMA